MNNMATFSGYTGRKAISVGSKLAFYVALIIIWELSVVFFKIPELILPKPSSVVVAMSIKGSYLLFHAGITIYETLVGFALAAVVGILMAVVMVYWQYLRSTLVPGIMVFNAFPKIAVAPIMIIWFGLGLESKFIMAFLVAVFPILINTITGLLDVDPDLLDLARLNGARAFRTFYKIRLPHALPNIIDGFKVAVPLAIIGAIIGEFVASRFGIGYAILIAYSLLESATIFAGLVIIAAIALVMFYAVVVWEKIFLRWRPSERRK